MECKFDIILFDFDDTLFDYEKTEARALEDAFKYHGLVYRTSYYEVFKKINREMWEHRNCNDVQGNSIMKRLRFEELLKQINVTNNKISTESLSKKYTEYSKNGDIIDGVEETINILANNVQLCVLSNGPSTPRKEKLQNSVIAGKLEFYTSETYDGKYSKPDLEFFLRVLKNYKGASYDRTLMVGDKLSTDILGANRAGIKSVWFKYKEHDEPLDVAKPDYIITNFRELLKIVYPMAKSGCFE